MSAGKSRAGPHCREGYGSGSGIGSQQGMSRGTVRGRARTTMAVAIVLGMLAGGCRDGGARQQEPVRAEWREVMLPAVPDGRATVGDVVSCGGRWYALGGVRTTDGDTRPAAWSSVDGLTWNLLPLRPTTVWGPRHLFASAACSQDRVAALGYALGGAHGLPRYSTWWGDAGTGLSEVDAPFELFGGPDAISFGRIAGGSGTSRYVIAGTWDSAANRAQAAAWTSPDGSGFTRVDGGPGLASTDTALTAASTAAYVGDRWLLGGSVLRVDGGGRRDPGAWSSADGAGWRREQAAGTFGRFAGQAVPALTALAVATTPAGPTAYVAGSDGAALKVWASTDAATWRPVRLPVTLAADGRRTLLLAERDRRLLLVADDGARVRLFLS